MTGFNGGLALTGVEGAVLLVLLVLFVREGGCAACGGAGLCACCDCLDESLRRPADADVLCGAECGDGVVCFESASVCLSWAPSKAWRTSSSFSGVSMGVLSGCGCSASESSGANSEATGSGIGTGMGVGADACGVLCDAVFSGDHRISSVPAPHHIGCVMGSLANSNQSCLSSCTRCCNAMWLSSSLL